MPIIKQQTKRKMPHAKNINKWWYENELDMWWDKFHQIDLYEPSCYGCGWSFYTKDEACDEKEVEQWAFNGLERCHLVDRCMGGSDDPNNLALLCHVCHKKMPSFDIGEREMAVTWITGQLSYIKQIETKIQSFLDSGYTLEEVSKFDTKIWQRG